MEELAAQFEKLGEEIGVKTVSDLADAFQDLAWDTSKVEKEAVPIREPDQYDECGLKESTEYIVEQVEHYITSKFPGKRHFTKPLDKDHTLLIDVNYLFVNEVGFHETIQGQSVLLFQLESVLHNFLKSYDYPRVYSVKVGIGHDPVVQMLYSMIQLRIDA